jgi:hypothetical protein
MSGPSNELGSGPIMVRYQIVGDGAEIFNQMLQCMEHPEDCALPLTLKDGETGNTIDVVARDFEGMEFDPAAKPPSIHFMARTTTNLRLTGFVQPTGWGDAVGLVTIS